MTAFPKSKVITADKVQLETLAFAKQQLLAFYEVMSGYSWNTTGGGVLFRHSLTYDKLAKKLAELMWSAGGKVFVHSNRNPLNKPKWIFVPGFQVLLNNFQINELGQTKPRDLGVWKSKGSGVLNKMRIRVPHR